MNKTERTVLFEHYNDMSVNLRIGYSWYDAIKGKTPAARAKGRRELVAKQAMDQFLTDSMFSLEDLDYKAMGL